MEKLFLSFIWGTLTILAINSIHCIRDINNCIFCEVAFPMCFWNAYKTLGATEIEHYFLELSGEIKNPLPAFLRSKCVLSSVLLKC